MRRRHANVPVNPDTVAAPIGSYSQSVRVETADATWIYVSGQIAIDLDGKLVGPNDLPAQTRQVFENLRAILEANGATFGDVVKIETYFTTLDGLAEHARGPHASTCRPNHRRARPSRWSRSSFPTRVIEVDVVAVVPS